jgi:hypothetical protein
MSESKTFYGVTQGLFNCLRTRTEREDGSLYDPPHANAGTMSTRGTGWAVVLRFSFDAATGTLFFQVQHKSWMVPASAVWSGLSDTLNGCRQD